MEILADGKNQTLFVFDEKENEYIGEIQGITFSCDILKNDYEDLAYKLADKYKEKLPELINFISPDIEQMFGVSEKTIIEASLGQPSINLEIETLSYLNHTLDDVHIIVVEYSGILENFHYCSIDG